MRRNTLGNLVVGRGRIEIVARTRAVELPVKVNFAESRLGTLWSAFYNCQDFASEVATGRPQSFQREAVAALSLIAAGGVWLSNQQPSRKRTRRVRG